MKYRYTIIIPHHNIPILLRRCLLSIPRREDLQVIVVDDKSDEDNLVILKELGKTFPYVEFIYQKEGCGAGKARNVGLSYAKGDYVIFADADDFFNYCFDKFLDDYKNVESDAVFFNANSLDTDTYATAYRSLHLNGMIKTYGKHPSKALDELRFAFGEPWCKMVKRKIIEDNGIRFSETIIHNDTKYSYLIGLYCKNISVDKRAVYCVTDRKGSVSKRVSIDRLLTRVAVFAEANSFFKTNGIKRFDERMLRPFIGFIAKRDWRNARKCIEIMKDNNMTALSIYLHCLLLPFYFLSRSKFIFKKTILKFI